MSKNNAKKKIITYLVLTFVLSSIFYVLISQNGGVEAEGASGFVLFLMWSPGVAGLITTFIYQRNLRGMGWRLGKPKYYAIAYFLPILYAGIAYGVIWLFGLGEVDTSLLGGNWMLKILGTLTGGILLSATMALGEEIGWRGLLIPQLAKITSFTRTVLISGVIWGLWHVPLIIGGGYSSGAPAWWAVACFMVLIVGMSFAFAWLRLASGSIWPAVLLHAVHNAFIQSILDKITVDTGNTAYFTTEFGLALAIMGVVIGVIFLAKGRSLDLTHETANANG